MHSLITFARRAVLAVWVALITLVLSIVLLSHVAPALGYQLIIIKGPSMEPTMPLGSLAIERPTSPENIVVGQVVTYVLPNHVVVTHRVSAVRESNGELLIETHGDANAAPDPALQPGAAVTGVVEAHLPLAGFLLAFLAVPTGMLSAISLLGSLLLLLWLLEDLEDDERAGRAHGLTWGRV